MKNGFYTASYQYGETIFVVNLIIEGCSYSIEKTTKNGTVWASREILGFNEFLRSLPYWGVKFSDFKEVA